MKKQNLTASQKIDLWIETNNDPHIRAELLEVKKLYPEYCNDAYYPKNPYFPNILNHPLFKDEQKAQEFIHLFFPESVALAYDQYLAKYSKHA
ncbi:MAG: hypothetical protein ACI35P_17560 [Bacillus sp. (in: firmicutes)]